ncbi:hypothetical protein FRC08_002114 [Ceratobasidium sp. 394]|nr:hypothetical protein FRC08_002114 [Ceratobasidium sp. 394]
MPYWSPPPESQPLLYYDPGYQYVFPPHSPPYQPAFPVVQHAAEPNEPRFPYALHPQAPPFVPSGRIKPLLAPTLPPAPRLLDPLAQALRRTMPKVRAHRAAPGERRPATTDTMDPSGVSDKFIYVEHVPCDASPETLKAAFERCGPLKGIFIRFQAERGMVVLAFYDTRHAAAALAQMQESPDMFFDGVSITARTPSYAELTKLLPNSPIVAESDSRVYVTLVGQTTSLGPQMQNLLATYGDIKTFRVVGMHYKAFNVDASASSASLSLKHVFPLTPDNRTVSTAPSTPAGLGRKMSLPPFQGPLPPPATNQWTSPPVGSEPAEELDGFISLRTTAPSATSPSSGSASRSTLGSAHMCLPASARAVLDLLRDPPPERNRIPNKMSTKNLIDFIDQVTPRAIDFLYLRFDFQNECNVGYAFVNFIHVSDLLNFMKARLGRKWNMYASEKVLGAGYANYQGKEALVGKSAVTF